MNLSAVPFRIVLAVLALATFATWAATSARADDYPSRPVKIIVPFGAGGPTDIYTRDIGEELRKALTAAELKISGEITILHLNLGKPRVRRPVKRLLCP